jgi:hypothetical protein
MKLVDAATVLQVDPSCLTWWAQNKDDLKANSKAGSNLLLHSGLLGILKDIEMGLLNYIEEWQQKEFEVNHFTLLRKAGQLRPAILENEKSLGAAKICISCYYAKNNLTHRIAMHKAQHNSCEVEAKTKEFLEYFLHRLKHGSHHPDYVLNMDQTLVYHLMDRAGLSIAHCQLVHVNE